MEPQTTPVPARESTGPRNWAIRWAVGVSLGSFAVINIALSSLGPYFARLHRINMMQPGRVDLGSSVTPRFDWSTGQEETHYWKFIPDARTTRLVVLDGMSQQYAINDERVGDLITPEILDDSLGADGDRVYGIAAPNLTNEELLLHLVTLALHPETTPALLVIGVCFDKMRNVDIRPAMQEQLLGRPEVAAEWKRIADSLRGDFSVLSIKMSATLVTRDEQEPVSLSKRVEADLVRDIAFALPVVRLRSDLRAYILGSLVELRNWVFHIKTSTKRPMLADRFALNQKALITTLRYARQRGIRVIVYVIPLNPLADSPYVSDEYASFKTWIANTSAQEGARFANLESTVSRDDWGLLNGEPDFKHFKEEGHKTTAHNLLPLIRAELPDRGRK